MGALNFCVDYKADSGRYDGRMPYRKCGNSGIRLPELSLGFWWNFGGINPLEESREKILYAFDHGITCFDLANNYGPPFGTAEQTFGRVYKDNLRPYRNEMIVTTKAGYNMWEGPYGCGSSRKMLMASIDDSLRRMNLDYVDIFYSHRYDPETPIDETMQALVDIVRQGKALYVGLSRYPVDKLLYAMKYLQESNVPCLIYQGRYNMLDRGVEQNILRTLSASGIGFTAFCPIAQGILTDKYLNGIPADSRVGKGHYLTEKDISADVLRKVAALNAVALRRGQTLAQMATAWLLAREEVTSVIIGPRTTAQLIDSLGAVTNTSFDNEELKEIDKILNE
ncbi:MAG: aldo/keto reductase [Bacteroidetes bacterium]|uniref:Aldo/keto reductase n=1 Tax=Candidatus Limisoma faecipullorum TaxID=2840854 RepID=A0A9D9IPL0_9BACT|nr:aldo/keto reductase [Candidatus Limisoma faecipullorum]